MAISLDYIGKFIIMTVVIAVAITLILTFQNDVEGNVPSVPGNDNGGNPETEVITIDTSDDSQMYQKIANLVKLCNERGKQRSTSFTCFVLVSETGDPFEFGPADLPGVYPDGGGFGYTSSDDVDTLILRYDIEKGYPTFSVP